jgi:hypothetical protein
VNVIYKRSWRDIFSTNSQRRLKERKRTKKKETKRPVENDTSMEIHKRRAFPQRFGKACWLFHISAQGPAMEP